MRSMQSHVVLARLSSSLYLLTLGLVVVVLLSLLLSLLIAPLGNWLEGSGALRLLIASLFYVAAPLGALFAALGLASRCPTCRAPYQAVKWAPKVVGRSREFRQGLALVRSHARFARTGQYSCPKCGTHWRGEA